MRTMIRRRVAAAVATFFLTAAGVPPLAAQLPVLDPPWLGYFAVFDNSHFQLGITSQGKITLVPIGNKNQPVAKSLMIPIDIIVEEIKPGGKTTIKKLKPQTLVSAQPATAKLTKTVVRGKVAGDASPLDLP